jgi:hypothetical protein
MKEYYVGDLCGKEKYVQDFCGEILRKEIT